MLTVCIFLSNVIYRTLKENKTLKKSSSVQELSGFVSSQIILKKQTNREKLF